MSNRSIERAKQLFEEGDAFTYENFSSKDVNGYTRALTTKYTTWKTKVEIFISSTFGKSSPVFELFKQTDDIRVLGNGLNQFEIQQSTILGALQVSIDTLEFE